MVKLCKIFVAVGIVALTALAFTAPADAGWRGRSYDRPFYTPRHEYRPYVYVRPYAYPQPYAYDYPRYYRPWGGVTVRGPWGGVYVGGW